MARQLRHHQAGGWYHVAHVCGAVEADASPGRRSGDKRRDITLWLGRRHCGLTLAELGAHMRMTAHAVSKAVSRMDTRPGKDRALQRSLKKIETEIWENQ